MSGRVLSRRGAAGMLLLATAIWGGGFLASQAALDHCVTSRWILAVRFSLGSLVLLIAFFPRILKSTRRSVLHGLGAGLILFLAFFAQIHGQDLTTIPNTAFLTSTNVLMVPFITWLVTGVRPKGRIFLMCLVTMLGVICLTLDGELRLSPNAGDLLVLLCAFFFAAHIVYLDRVCANDDSVQIAFFQLLTCALLSIFSLACFPSPIPEHALAGSILPLLYSGLLSTGFCYLLQTRAQTVLPAAESGIIMSTEGMFGTGFALLFGSAAFRPAMPLGGLLVTAAVIFSQQDASL